MPRKRKLNRKRYSEQRKIYHALRLEEKIYALRKNRKERLRERYSEGEKVLLSEVMAAERKQRFEALELELMNFERKQVGLLPLESIPIDPAQRERALEFERQRGRDSGRLGFRR